ncbi:MAG: rRNA pseudouridine synthase [Gemmatimonadaceae bacterium]|nr:rRNA pseudouridine synthase [Gemmatimonadaceae bacterium]
MPPRPRRAPTARSTPVARTDTVAARGTVSLARALSKLGICSRSQAEVAVRDGRVTVNGRRVTDSSRRVVPERDVIVLDGARTAATARVYIALNKPRGLLTTRSDPRGRGTVYECLDDPSLPFLGPVGRLDQASEGLLLFTNDTQWANAITAPASHVVKTYHVQVDRVPDAALVAALQRGVTTDDGERLGAVRVAVLRAGARHGWLEIELDEGRNRQVRRMLEACDTTVLRLVRVAIGPLALGTLAKGAWRHLLPDEIVAVRPPAGGVVRGDR